MCTEAADNCFDLALGGRFNVTYYLRNVYNVNIDGSNLEYRGGHFGGGWINNWGIAIKGTDINNFGMDPTSKTISSINARSTLEYTLLYDIPLNNDFAWVHTYGYNQIYDRLSKTEGDI